MLLLWILSAAFESIQPTKPIALAIGPQGAGKSNLFRRIGQLLFGSSYQVDALRRDKEDDFWGTITSRPFATFDNVDGYFPWLNDALAQAATGVQVTKRRLYTTNATVAYTPRCIISLTARTPTFRREDVASRLLIFHLDRLPEKRGEYELLEEIRVRRNELMSNFAQMLNDVLAIETPADVDQSIRLADFARIAARIGEGLGLGDMTSDILRALRKSQFAYATEDDSLVIAIDAWLSQSPNGTGEMDLGHTNNGRRLPVSQLFTELRDLAMAQGLPWRIKSPTALGITVRNMEEELGHIFRIEQQRNKRHRTISIEKLDEDSNEI